MKRKSSPVAVDEAHLDKEWVRQPDLMLNATEAAADAGYEYDVATAAFDLKEAELFLAIKETPSEFNLGDKPSVDVIKSAVIVHPDYQAAQRLVIEAKRRKDRMAGRVTALAHKRTSIENLTTLQCINYGSEPRTPNFEGARERVNAAKKDAAFKAIKNRNRNPGE